MLPIAPLMLTKAVFYVFAVMLAMAAIRVVTVRNAVHAALYLVLTFFTAAALWLLLHAEFLAIVLVLVYVGAVMVLFLFVVMMLDVNVAPLREGFIRYLPLGIVVATLVLIEFGLVLLTSITDRQVSPASIAADYSNTEALGEILYTVYVYPFEIAAVILLVAIVAAIALTLRRRSGLKRLRAEQQVRVRASDRIRLISMPAESHEKRNNRDKE